MSRSSRSAESAWPSPAPPPRWPACGSGSTAALATALVVRETELTLYGFMDADEREVFEALQTAAGVGPRLAQAVLAVHRPDDVRRAVATEDLTALCKVPGIGKKGAARIVLDLKDRLGAASARVSAHRSCRFRARVRRPGRSSCAGRSRARLLRPRGRRRRRARRRRSRRGRAVSARAAALRPHRVAAGMSRPESARRGGR